MPPAREGSVESKEQMSEQSRKLNIGGGDIPLAGYENIDRKFGGEAYPLKDNTGKPIPDASCDEVRASHILEHFSNAEVPLVLAEWSRVLKPGGRLRVAVPDFEYCAKGYLDGKKEPFGSYLLGGQTDENDFHRSVFNEERLVNCMTQVGIENLTRWQSEVEDCAKLPVSLNLQGTKRTHAPELSKPFPKVKIAAVMSMPRLAFADNMFCAHQTLIPLGIPFERITGAFWGQCLERIMTTHVDADWIVTLDYDSIFNPQIFHRLAVLFDENPHVDAMAPLQVKRESASPLWHLLRDDGTYYTEGEQIPIESVDKPLTRSKTAHFGLTFIRTAALKKMSHPWFLGVPNKDGMWEEGRMDDDIYFWDKWHKTGNSLYVATQISIGHLQLMSSWVSKEFGVTHQYLDDWHANGAPKEARQ